MTGFGSINPAVVFAYFLCVTVSGIFTLNPIISVISLAGALLLWAVLPVAKNKRTHIYPVLLTLFCAVGNPLFSHNGETVLLVINNNPITLQSTLYGLFIGIMLSAAVYWFSSFSLIVSSDKIIYTLGFISQKAALVLTMALRFVPLYIRKARQINGTQKALGLYKDETVITRFRGGVRVFSVLKTNMIEKTIITSDSMAARGYTGGKRSGYPLFKFTFKDAAFLAVTVFLTLLAAVPQAKGALDFNFYPHIDITFYGVSSVAAYTGYALLCLCPSVYEGSDRLKWHYLISRI